MEDANDIYQLVFHPSPTLKEKLVEEIHWIDDEHKAIAEKNDPYHVRKEGLRPFYATSGIEIQNDRL